MRMWRCDRCRVPLLLLFLLFLYELCCCLYLPTASFVQGSCATTGMAPRMQHVSMYAMGDGNNLSQCDACLVTLSC